MVKAPNSYQRTIKLREDDFWKIYDSLKELEGIRERKHKELKELNDSLIKYFENESVVE